MAKLATIGIVTNSDRYYITMEEQQLKLRQSNIVPTQEKIESFASQLRTINQFYIKDVVRIMNLGTPIIEIRENQDPIHKTKLNKSSYELLLKINKSYKYLLSELYTEWPEFKNPDIDICDFTKIICE